MSGHADFMLLISLRNENNNLAEANESGRYVENAY